MAVGVHASMLAAAIVAVVGPAYAQSERTHLIPLPHPEILHPNEPTLPPRTLHPRVFHARPPHLARHQHLVPLPHPELLYRRSRRSFGSGFILSETLRTGGDGPAPSPAKSGTKVDAPREVGKRILPCWHPPPLGNDATHAVTVRVEFARDGSIIGKPWVTYVKTGPGAAARKAMVDSIRAALRQCTPLPFTARFGAAMAGYPLVIRFTQVHGRAPRR